MAITDKPISTLIYISTENIWEGTNKWWRPAEREVSGVILGEPEELTASLGRVIPAAVTSIQ